jgi:ribosomal-protein-alanine N-acetyltransferase
MKIAAEPLVRRMAADDLAAVAEIDRLSFSAPWSLDSYRYELLENPYAYIWVAEWNAKIVGLMVAWLIVDELHIGTIATHPAHRHQGIAARLLETGLRESIALGATLSHLEVRKSNLAAQALYRRFGYEVVGERKAYYPDNLEDAILMSVHHLGDGYLHWLDGGRQGAYVPNL